MADQNKPKRDWTRLFHRDVSPDEQELLDKMLDRLEVLDVDIFYYPFAGEFVKPEIRSEIIDVVPLIEEWMQKYGKKSLQEVVS